MPPSFSMNKPDYINRQADQCPIIIMKNIILVKLSIRLAPSEDVSSKS